MGNNIRLEINVIYILNYDIRGCGVYDDNGLKNEYWIDLHDPFMKYGILIDYSTGISYLGRYNNGKK